MSIMTLCTAGLLTLGFQAPHLWDALMLAVAGVGNGIAQFWWTRSLSDRLSWVASCRSRVPRPMLPRV